VSGDSKEIKGNIKSIYESLNYIELKEKRDKLVEELINLKWAKNQD